jgi:hypothetical protein
MSKYFESLGLKLKSNKNGTIIFTEEIPENNAVRYLIFEEVGKFYVHKAKVGGDGIKTLEFPMVIGQELHNAISNYMKKELKW